MARAVALTIIAVIASCSLVTFAVWRIKPADGGRFTPRKPHRHVVERGDTLSSISRKYYGTPDLWPRIAQANNLKENQVLRPGASLDIPGVTDKAFILWRGILVPAAVFALLALLTSGLVVREAAASQNLRIGALQAAYSVLLVALTSASVVASALASVIIWPDILGLGILIVPFYVLPVWVFLTAAEGFVLHTATGISHGRAVILGVILNVIIGIVVAVVAAFTAVHLSG
ncbi:MAG: LysM peptidoglycan-binding domain-containing protein [Planctomycetes bacterium]|nr:LysM peptidoglycan-binding domain-containing protein [Planctomycetota bacterium]